jgi:hypothetical protein
MVAKWWLSGGAGSIQATRTHANEWRKSLFYSGLVIRGDWIRTSDLLTPRRTKAEQLTPCVFEAYVGLYAFT